MSEWNDLPTEGDLAKAKEIISGEAPLMAPPPDGRVALFMGLAHDGIYMKDAEVKELTGADEEEIARVVNASNEVGAYYNAVLMSGIVRIGSVVFAQYDSVVRRSMVDSLLLGDREWLFVNIIRATYGDERTIVITCPACQKSNDLIYTLSEDVKTRPLVESESPSGAWFYTLRDGTRVSYRLFNGADQAESVRRRTATVAEQNTVLLSRAILTVNGKAVVDPVAFVRDMGAMDRRNLLAEIEAKQPGPYFEEVKLPCASCGVEALFKPTWADLL